jgi:GNAT superfamily N-acetyltransferase
MNTQDLDPAFLTSDALQAESKQVLRRYFEFVEETVRKIGMELTIETEFAPLVQLQRDHANEGLSLSPAYNPQVSDVGERNGFWIRAMDDRGNVVATSAARVYDLSNTFGHELLSLRIFYGSPIPDVARGDSIALDAPQAEAWKGRVVYSGGVWVRPDYRRRGFTKIVPRLVRAIATVRWCPPRYWTMVTPENDRNGLTRAYGSWHLEGRVSIHLTFWSGPKEWLLFSMTPDVLLADLEQSLAAQADPRERR